MPINKIITIGGKKVGYNQKCYIIAEAGVNHNGRLDLALKMIDAAKRAGADAVKFQTFKAGQVVIPKGRMAKYQRENIGKTKSQLEMLKKLELNEKFYKPIINLCKKRKITFISTPHGGFESVDFLQSLDTPVFKFGSGDLNNLPVLQYAAKFHKPMILGTGMSTLKEVKEAIDCIKKLGNKKIIVLHCTSNYPCPLDEVNLRAMQTMMKKLDVLVGYSDHTLGINVSVMAVALGACVIEKHFTLDRNMQGLDHKASIEPEELKEMIKQIRNVKEILGSPIKKPNKSEMLMIKTIRKSIVSLRDIKKGEKFTKENIGIKRPGTRLAPKYYFEILGKISRKNIKKDSLLAKEMFF